MQRQANGPLLSRDRFDTTIHFPLPDSLVSNLAASNSSTFSIFGSLELATTRTRVRACLLLFFYLNLSFGYEISLTSDS